MKWRDPNWRYHDANETNKPGYLRRKFARLRQEQKQDRAEREQKVTALPLTKKGQGK
jgi:hypothetical protein